MSTEALARSGSWLGLFFCLSISAVFESWQGHVATPGWRTNPMTAYVLVIVLAAGGHHQSFAVGYPDQGRASIAAASFRLKSATPLRICFSMVSRLLAQRI